MKRIIILALIISASISFSGCTKYEEGSNFSLISAKNRLVNSWTMTKYEVNGVDETSNVPALDIIFYKNGTFKRTLTAFVSVTDQGDWSFVDGKASVQLSKADGTIQTYKIIKLKNKDLKVQETNGGNTNKFTFVGL